MASLFDRLQSEIEARQRMEGITPADLLDLSPELRRIINMIMRQKEMGLAEIYDTFEICVVLAHSAITVFICGGN